MIASNYLRQIVLRQIVITSNYLRQIVLRQIVITSNYLRQIFLRQIFLRQIVLAPSPAIGQIFTNITFCTGTAQIKHPDLYYMTVYLQVMGEAAVDAAVVVAVDEV